MNRLRILRVIMVGVLASVQVIVGVAAVSAQSIASPAESSLSVNVSLSLVPSAAVAKYADPQTGLTVDEAVAFALEHKRDRS